MGAPTWMNLEDVMLREASYKRTNAGSFLEWSHLLRHKVEWWLPKAGEWGDAVSRDSI